MIAFVTLFLGLVIGPLEVEVLVSSDTAAVELLLDDVLVARMTSPPWKARLDLGDELKPRELEAVALSAEGVELDRATQRLNLPRPPAEVDLLLEAGTGGEGSVVRLAWESIEAREPRTVEVSFDGQPLTVVDPSRVELPPHDPEQLHFLRADVVFSDHVSTFGELTFGGTYADGHHTELTAVPISLARPADLPAPGALDGWLVTGDAPLDVIAVEEGTADIVVVRDRGAQEGLDGLVRRPSSLFSASLRFAAPLRRDHRIRMLSPVPKEVARDDYTLQLFQPSELMTADDGGMHWLLTRVRPRLRPQVPQRLADAVAVAGMTASAGAHRRAIVLVVGDEPEDDSQLSIETVRGYLRELRVPLFVWTVSKEENAGGWGSARSIASVARLERAVKELRESLATQRILWVPGNHLPNRVVLGPRAEAAALTM